MGSARPQARLMELLSDSGVLKVGVGVDGDVRALRSRLPGFDPQGSFVDLTGLVSKRWPGLQRLGLRKCVQCSAVWETTPILLVAQTATHDSEP